MVIKKNKESNSILFVDTENDIEYLANYEEVVENDYNLSISTYAVKEVVKEVIDPKNLQTEAHNALKEHIAESLEFTRVVCGFENLNFQDFVLDILELVKSFLD